MKGTRGSIVAVTAALVLLVAVRPASGADPTLTTSTDVATPGDTVVVQLEGWPVGPVDVTVCGNGARRGSEDCDLIGGQAVGIKPVGVTLLDFQVTTPPVPCPCVLRASTSASDLVRTVPLAVRGVPTGPELPPDPSASPSNLALHATLKDTTQDWPVSWAPAFAGPVRRALVVTLENRGTSALIHLRVVGTVGRGASSGEPIPVRRIERLDPGTRRTISLPVQISAPAWGDYMVSGRVYGSGEAVAFRVKTSNDPWGLELLVPLTLLVIAHVLRRRERAARLREQQAAALVASSPLEGSSPDVGAKDEGSSPSHVYDPDRSMVPSAGNGHQPDRTPFAEQT